MKNKMINFRKENQMYPELIIGEKYMVFERNSLPSSPSRDNYWSDIENDINKKSIIWTYLGCTEYYLIFKCNFSKGGYIETFPMHRMLTHVKKVVAV